MFNLGTHLPPVSGKCKQGPVLSICLKPIYLLPQTEDFMGEKKDAIYICNEVEMEVIHCGGRRE